MKTESRIKKALTKGDLMIIALVAVISLVWFIFPLFNKNDSVRLVIYREGEEQISVNLSALVKGETYAVGGCEIYADSNGVKFVASCCEDRLCVRRGLMSNAGDSMACVPERVVVRLYGVTDTDIVAY